MQIKNSFLDALNAHSDLIKRRNIDVTLIAGIEQKTIQYLRNVHNGMIWSPVSSEAGDGNVVVTSAFALDGDKYLIEGDHMQVIFKSYDLLRKKLS